MYLIRGTIKIQNQVWLLMWNLKYLEYEKQFSLRK